MESLRVRVNVLGQKEASRPQSNGLLGRQEQSKVGVSVIMQSTNPARLPKDPTELLRLMIDVGILDAELELSGQFHRSWRRIQVAIEKSPWAVKRAFEMKVAPQDSAMITAIIGFFPDGLHQKDAEILYNALTQKLDEIPALPLNE